MNIDFRINGVDPNSPLLYRILISERFCYIGCANSARRPEKAYRRNLQRMIDGRPYRRNKPDGFRVIHKRMLEAFHQGDPIVIELIRNVTRENKFVEEQMEIALCHKEFGDRLLNYHPILRAPHESSQPCPICGTAQRPYARYPHYLCRDCSSQASDESGRQLEFYNVSFSGGFQAAYADTGELRESHVCFVRGIRCWADEARFGGIVIQAEDVTSVA